MNAKLNEWKPKGALKIKNPFGKIGKVLQEEKVSEIFKEDADFQTCYDKWKAKVEEIVERHKTKVKKTLHQVGFKPTLKMTKQRLPTDPRGSKKFLKKVLVSFEVLSGCQ